MIIVESAWTERNLKLDFIFDRKFEQFFFLKSITPKRYLNSHKSIYLTSVRKPLNGYQKGKYFLFFIGIVVILLA